jgi:hypothetical protein
MDVLHNTLSGISPSSRLSNTTAHAGKSKPASKRLSREGSSKSQTRNCHAITNHLNFCMMAATIAWIYADYLDKTSQRCYAVNSRRHFTFSDVRKLITQAALNKDFVSFYPEPGKPKQNYFIDALLRMVA